jgi:hypothetical protein
VSDALFDYLHLDGPEYDYLGHFRDMEWICEGHNDLGIEQQIDNGQIPNLAIGERNLPADAEPGNIANSGVTGASGATAAQTATQGMGGQAPSGGSGLGSSIANAGMKTIGDALGGEGAMASDFSSGEDVAATTNVGADFMGNLGATGGAGSALASLFALALSFLCIIPLAAGAQSTDTNLLAIRKQPPPLTLTTTGVTAYCPSASGTVVLSWIPTPGTGDGKAITYTYTGSSDFVLSGSSLVIGPNGIAPANCGTVENVTITATQP